MKARTFNIALLFGILIFTQGCYTLYNPKTISIDIVEPARVKLPEDYKKMAVRYNNVNVAWNPNTAIYLLDSESVTDSTNLDSIASKIYFELFISTLKEQQFFEKITEIKAADYSHTQLIDTLTKPEFDPADSSLTEEELTSIVGAHILAAEIRKTKPMPGRVEQKKYLDPKLALYSEEELSAIADTCSADVLLSLDHFYTENALAYLEYSSTAKEVVHVHYSWTAYDLKEKKLAFHFSRGDTIFWSHQSSYKKEALKRIPPRRDAVLNAADIAGANTAEFLVPHWRTVQRIFYESGNPEIKPTSQMVNNGKWLEAAEVWKKYTNDKNKALAAKCKFNMAVACEMNDQIDAALGWVVESYYVYGEKNEVHSANCREYINILAQRKQDQQIIEKQLSLDE
ncbi:DUF6340 family protein [Maribellus mangrovi]|uniref:DUF6340 family protein n=1 Tax=Maribellus mangrovi TaxID=3133146 RepID=UPI0030ED0889